MCISCEANIAQHMFFLRGWCEPSEHLQTRDAQSHIEIALHRMRISERDGAKEYTQHRICM